jgi:hypothetical protein
LIDKLSPEARAQFEKVTDSDQQRKVIHSWLQSALRHQWESRGSGRRIAQEDLERFFKNDLSVEEREKLLNLPPDAMQKELRQKYVRHFERSGFGPQDRRKGKGFREGFGPGGRGPRPRREGPQPDGPPREGPPHDRPPGEGPPEEQPKPNAPEESAPDS